MPNSETWRNWRLSLSFANLVYLRAWADLIPVRTSDFYTRRTIPGFNLYFALIGDVLALSLLIFLVLRIAPRLPAGLRRLLPAAAIAMMAVAASFLKSRVLHYALHRDLYLLEALIVGLAALAFKYSAAATRIVKNVALAATPCLAVTFLAPLYYLSHPMPMHPDPPLARKLPGSPPVRVVWIIFDEWDQRLTFADRAPGTILPTLDRLMADSFSATQALAVQAQMGVPVNHMATAEAVTSLLYAKPAIGFVAGDQAKHIAFEDGDTSTVFGSGNSIFARFRALGWNSGVAGWYLPYCRYFAADLTDCYWDQRYDQSSSAGRQPLQAALDETRMLMETAGISPAARSLVTERHFAEYRELLATAKRYVADPSLGLVFLHFNVPHEPYFFDPDSEHFGRTAPSADPYDDALLSVDHAASEILSALDATALNSRTAVILSADHPLRSAANLDPHVPFIVHLPGYEVATALNREFSTIGTANLALAIAQGQVQSPADIWAFLTRTQ